MVITPQTDLYLLKVPLEMSNDNKLTFADADAQYRYFFNLPKLAGDGMFTYQRKDGVIRFGALIDNIMEYNYVMYRNTAYSNKWFYAYITKMEWSSDQVTLIQIKTDVWQTYQFQLTYKPVLIDREHPNTDVAGDNLLPESVELGEYVTNGNVENFGNPSDVYRMVIEVSMVENESETTTLTATWEDGSSHDFTPDLNDIYRGTTPLVVSGTSAFEKVRDVYDLAGLSDAIINVYMLPASLIGETYVLNLRSQIVGSTRNKRAQVLVPKEKIGVFDISTKTISKPTSIDSYTPRNKKLLTAPYCYFNISNNAGTSIPYYYEDFNSNVSFKVEGTFGVSGNVKAIPIDYKNISSSENGLDFSISGAKYPVCSWKSDSYTNWLTQNAVNLNYQWSSNLVGGAMNIAGSTLGGGLLGAFGSSIQVGASLVSLANEQHIQKSKASFIPDQVHGNQNVGDFLWTKYRSQFTYLPMSIKARQAEILDEYFDQFGYKCNRVKIPNINGRRNWNFVKTIGCYIEANIPQDDLQEIKAMFDKGITFWHNPATFADYSQSNDIV